jgi:hypothetical protein
LGGFAFTTSIIPNLAAVITAVRPMGAGQWDPTLSGFHLNISQVFMPLRADLSLLDTGTYYRIYDIFGAYTALSDLCPPFSSRLAFINALCAQKRSILSALADLLHRHAIAER